MKISKKFILEIVKGLGRATSSDVVFELLRRGFGLVSGKRVSMMLLRCYRQGLLGRARWGRKFVYWIKSKGKERSNYISSVRSKREIIEELKKKNQKEHARGSQECVLAMRVCDIALALSPDKVSEDFVCEVRDYFFTNFIEFAPYIKEQLEKGLDNLYEFLFSGKIPEGRILENEGLFFLQWLLSNKHIPYRAGQAALPVLIMQDDTASLLPRELEKERKEKESAHLNSHLRKSNFEQSMPKFQTNGEQIKAGQQRIIQLLQN